MKTIIKILLIGLFFSLIALGLISCGARKVNKEQSKEEKKSEIVDNSVIEKQSESNVKETTIVKTDDKNETVTEETTYEPKDETKESFVIEKDGTKVVLNNAKKTVKKTTQKNNTQTSATENKDESKKEESNQKNNIQKIEESKTENKAKKVDQKQFNWLSLWWLYLIIIGVLYFIWRKFIKI